MEPEDNICETDEFSYWSERQMVRVNEDCDEMVKENEH